MIHKTILTILFLIAFSKQCNAQTLKSLEEINTVWEKFYQAFDSLDYKLMAEIHSEKLVRISGGKRILDYKTYINNYKTGFKYKQESNETNEISLRFFERISNDSVASERGVYKLIVNKNKPEEKAYYGQFHVIFKKENGAWKITMDYDSNELNSINEEDYTKAYAITEFDKFIKQ